MTGRFSQEEQERVTSRLASLDLFECFLTHVKGCGHTQWQRFHCEAGRGTEDHSGPTRSEGDPRRDEDAVSHGRSG